MAEGEPRAPLSRQEVTELDLLVARIKGEINAAAGAEAIDVGYRILISVIADRCGGMTMPTVATLEASTAAVAAVLRRMPGDRLQQIHVVGDDGKAGTNGGG